jgi:hypothetical protein
MAQCNRPVILKIRICMLLARIFAALLIAIVWIGCSSPASATKFPETGFRFRCDANASRHKNFNGWQCYGGGFYSDNGNKKCCIDYFSPFTSKIPSGRMRWNPDRIMLVRSKVATRMPDGGIGVEEIVEWILVERKNTEEFMQESSSCSINGQDAFLLSVLDRRKKTLGRVLINRSVRMTPCLRSALSPMATARADIGAMAKRLMQGDVWKF